MASSSAVTVGHDDIELDAAKDLYRDEEMSSRNAEILASMPINVLSKLPEAKIRTAKPPDDMPTWLGRLKGSLHTRVWTGTIGMLPHCLYPGLMMQRVRLFSVAQVKSSNNDIFDCYGGCVIPAKGDASIVTILYGATLDSVDVCGDSAGGFTDYSEAMNFVMCYIRSKTSLVTVRHIVEFRGMMSEYEQQFDPKIAHMDELLFVPRLVETCFVSSSGHCGVLNLQSFLAAPVKVSNLLISAEWEHPVLDVMRKGTGRDKLYAMAHNRSAQSCSHWLLLGDHPGNFASGP